MLLAKSETEMLYYWRMKHWDAFQQAAFGTHGIITFAQAKAIGVHSAEIYRWCKIGRLIKVGRGVFRLTTYPSRGFLSDMAALLAFFGEGSYLYGESVLALYDLCPTRSYVAMVAVPGRMRKTSIPEGVTVVKAKRGYRPVYHEGIACQQPMDAIRSCIGILERSRIMEAVDEAENKGYFMPAEAEMVRKDIENGKTAAQRARA